MLRRSIGKRQNRLLSSLGAAWDLNKSPADGPYFLKCVRSDTCDEFECVFYMLVCCVRVIHFGNLHYHKHADVKTYISCVSLMESMAYILVLLVENSLRVRRNEPIYMGQTGGF